MTFIRPAQGIQNFQAVHPQVNAFSFDFDSELLSEIRNAYQKDIAPYLQAPEQQRLLEGIYYQSQTIAMDDYYLLSYDTYPLLWVTNHNLKTHGIFERFFKSLKLKVSMRDLIKYKKKLIMYSGFFVVSNRANELMWHYDYRPGAEAYTLITPLFDWEPEHGHLNYQNKDQEVKTYPYKQGQAIVFGEGFLHSTQPYPTASKIRVLVSFTFGTDQWDSWEILKQNITEQSYFYKQPCGHPVDSCRCLQHWQQKKRFWNLLPSLKK